VEVDLEEDLVDEEPKPEVTHWKQGRCGRMCRGTYPIDAPSQQMLEEVRSFAFKDETVYFIFPFFCS